MRLRHLDPLKLQHPFLLIHDESRRASVLVLIHVRIFVAMALANHCACELRHLDMSVVALVPIVWRQLSGHQRFHSALIMFI